MTGDVVLTLYSLVLHIPSLDRSFNWTSGGSGVACCAKQAAASMAGKVITNAMDMFWEDNGAA